MNPRRLASDTSFSMTSGCADTLAMTGPEGARLVGLGTDKCNEPGWHSEPGTRRRRREPACGQMRNPCRPGPGAPPPGCRGFLPTLEMTSAPRNPDPD